MWFLCVLEFVFNLFPGVIYYVFKLVILNKNILMLLSAEIVINSQTPNMYDPESLRRVLHL